MDEDKQEPVATVRLGGLDELRENVSELSDLLARASRIMDGLASDHELTIEIVSDGTPRRT